MQKDALIIHTDGGSRGNPGPAACAFVAELDGNLLEGKSKFLGNNTNNFAEYQGVLLALEWITQNIKSFSFSETLFLLDSELVVKQINGLYKIKKPELQTLHTMIKKSLKDIPGNINFRNIPREQNKAADLLVNEELDRSI